MTYLAFSALALLNRHLRLQRQERIKESSCLCDLAGYVSVGVLTKGLRVIYTWQHADVLL